MELHSQPAWACQNRFPLPSGAGCRAAVSDAHDHIGEPEDRGGQAIAAVVALRVLLSGQRVGRVYIDQVDRVCFIDRDVAGPTIQLAGAGKDGDLSGFLCARRGLALGMGEACAGETVRSLRSSCRPNRITASSLHKTAMPRWDATQYSRAGADDPSEDRVDRRCGPAIAATRVVPCDGPRRAVETLP